MLVSGRQDSPRGLTPLVMDRRRSLQIVILLVMAVSLHVIPQILKSWFEPALSMVALMFVDAAVFAILTRSGTSLRVALGIAVMFAVVWWSRLHNLVALPSVALNLMMAGAFGVTLLPGRTALIQQIAAWSMAPEPVSPGFARYLRAQTLVWSIFFVLMAVTSVVLTLAAPFEWWSLFVNVLSWPLIAAVFLGEYVVRRTWFRDLPDHTPLQTMASALAWPAEAMRRALERR
jgi:uncharacterized membrane protein